MKAVKATILIGNIELDVYQIPNGEYRLAKGQVTNVVGLDHQRYAQILGSKQAQTLYPQGIREAQILKANDITTGKQVQLVSVNQAVVIWDIGGTDKGKALVCALACESIERRADAAFNITRSEEARNARVIEALTHCQDFHPKYTSWLKLDGITKTYGTEVNRLKVTIGLPLIPIKEYNVAQMRLLNSKETEYNLLRKLGKDHLTALSYL